MAPPPSFGDQEYWDRRFAQEHEFEWLLGFDAIKPTLLDTLQSHDKDYRPELLHIGCGSSSLSTKLASLVRDPEQIHNVDYSSVAIERGRKREVCQLQGAIGSRDLTQTRWSTLDLLSVEEVLSFSLHQDNNRRYDVIFDKSTSDAISCASDLEISLPYGIHGLDSESTVTSKRKRILLHPLYALAVHLAYLAAPNCHWIVLSYSNARFPFWDTKAEIEMGIDLSDDIVGDGFTHPGRLWRLVKHEEIIKPMSTSGNSSIVHRPPEVCHLYMLERMQVALDTN